MAYLNLIRHQGQSNSAPITLPILTTIERDALSGVVDGQFFYNSTDNKAQIRANGVWANCN